MLVNHWVSEGMAEFASITQAGATVTVTLAGDADYSVVTKLLDTFEQARSMPGVIRIVIDLAAVRFMDSSGLGAFVIGYRFARQDGLSFEVINEKPNVRSLLEITGVAHLFTSPAGDHVDQM